MIRLVILNGKILAEGADFTMSGDPAVPTFTRPIPPDAVVQVIEFDGGASERQDVYDTPATAEGKTEVELVEGDVVVKVKPKRGAADFTLEKRT